MRAERILVVIEQSESAKVVLDKAAALAHAENDAEVQIVQVIYEPLVEFNHLPRETAQALKLELMRAEERKLIEIVKPFRDRFAELETFTVWNQRVSDGVLHAAESFAGDLVIKAQHPTKPVFPRPPDDWNLLRRSQCPVLLSGPRPWVDSSTVLVAAALLDHKHEKLSRTLLDAGARLAGSLNKQLHAVCAYPATNSAVQEFAQLDHDEIESAVAQAAERQLAKLCAPEASMPQLHLCAGRIDEAIGECIKELDPALVVVGTAAREGVGGWVLGNTSEKLLGLVDHDLMVIG